MVTVGDVVEVLETAYPVRLAEKWDSGIGLTCGDRDEPVTRVLLAVDVDPATVEEAVAVGAHLLVTHHPLLFRAVQSVAADTPRGALVHRMVRAGIAHFAAHTNADRAVGGVNDALAEALGLLDLRPLDPAADGASPAEGLGRIGRLPQPMTLAEFAEHVATALPGTAGGVRAAAAAGSTGTVERVAVCGGAGSSLLPVAAAAGVDVFVTSELSHHVAGEYLAVSGNPALVEIAHFAGEWPWLNTVAAVLGESFPGSVATTVSTLRTDPWLLRRSGSDDDPR
ncbi:Nif3-like dinuclear metal center hexameric protein [Nakamurella silvestris]|nr:Nif3-like dinuclear metal center hexameric protein [Nakamurella silvestris]